MSEHPSPQEAHWPEGAIFTLGHSTLPIERFMAWLQTYDIERLVDIRTMPRSRHNPQFAAIRRDRSGASSWGTQRRTAPIATPASSRATRW
jgi:hypothetical protein